MRTRIAQTKYECDRCGEIAIVDHKTETSWLFVTSIYAESPPLEDSIPRNQEDKTEGRVDLCPRCRTAFVEFIKGAGVRHP
jgi:ribosomal protein S27AE